MLVLQKPSPSDTSDYPRTPRLDIGEIDAVPFSQNFRDLFDGLGLHISAPSTQNCRIVGSPDVSYEIQNFTNMKDFDPDWQHHEIEEIMVMSPKRSGSALPTILEDSMEVSSPLISIPIASLSDFEFEGLPAGAGADWTTNTKSCIRRDDGIKYTIKRKKMPRHYSWTEHNILEYLKRFELAFIPSLRWTFYSGEHRYIVIDYFPGGTIMDLINENGPFGSHRAVFYASELVAAISGLHSAGIVHRDLHPKSIFFDAHGHIVLANLEHAEFSSNTGILNLNQLEVDMLGYRAPELLLGWAHDSAVDCWSFGMVLYYMFFGSHPFGGANGTDDIAWLHDRIISSSIPMESLRLVHPMARDLILKCLERNPAMRWSIEKIKNHGYFSHVDWEKVCSKSLEAPSFLRPVMELDRVNIQETHRRQLSSSSSLFRGAQQPPASVSVLRGAHSGKGISKPPSNHDAPVLPELFMSAPKISIPEAVQEEDEPISISGTAGHPREDVHEENRAAIDAAERMSKFWDDIDKQEKGSVRSDNSLEFGSSTGAPYTKAPKLRKYRSAIQSQHRLFNISTASFQAKLRKKPRSTSALRQSRQPEPIENLPLGVHQIGSGIGFTYGTPAAAPSKISVCSFTPSCHLFHGGFSVLNRGFGLGHSLRRTKAKAENRPAPAPENQDPAMTERPACTDQEPMPTREVGNGTFIRDMYRTPSWILSPPDSVPSPLALVNAELSPFSGSSEPFTPATLVDEHDCSEEEVNISIPKNLEIELDFPYSQWAPDSTLRLVPPSVTIAEEEKLPGGFDSVNISSYSQVTEA